MSKPWRTHSCVPRRDSSRRPLYRNRESGFALLFVYAMAATVAIMLLMELPRVAFEAQRDKEQLLIDRGEQYTRGVTLFVRKFNRFPADFDALQNTQNLRFLRRKYIDPMTGKDDWRIIHVGPGGVFTDSLVYGAKKDGKQQPDQQNFITEIQQTGGNQLAPNQGVNVGTRQRQSDQPGAPGDPNNPNQSTQAALPQPAFPQSGFPQPGAPLPGFGMPQPGVTQNGVPQNGLPQPGMPQFDANGQPIPNPANAPVPNQGLPGQNGFPGGFPPGVQPPQGQAFTGQQPGQPFGQQPTQPPNAPISGAASLINQILTSPRPGGLNGLGGVPQGVDPFANPTGVGTPGNATTGTLTAPTAAPTAPTAQTIGGGMAGVASKYEQDGIKVYKEQKSYNKWEFVYDITQDPSRAGGTVPQAAPPPNGTTAMPNSFAPPAGTSAPTAMSGFNGAPPPPPPPPTPTQLPVTPQ